MSHRVKNEISSSPTSADLPTTESLIELLKSRLDTLSKVIDPLFAENVSIFERMHRLLKPVELLKNISVTQVSTPEEQKGDGSKHISLQELVSLTQKTWMRQSKTRWGNNESKDGEQEVHKRTLTESEIEELERSIKAELKKLGFIDAVLPPADGYKYSSAMVF